MSLNLYPGSSSWEPSSQAPWRDVPTKGEALGMTNVTPRAWALRGGPPVPYHWTPSVSPWQQTLWGKRNQPERKSYILLLQWHSFSTVRNLERYLSIALQVMNLESFLKFWYPPTHRYMCMHILILSSFSSFVFCKYVEGNRKTTKTITTTMFIKNWWISFPFSFLWLVYVSGHSLQRVFKKQIENAFYEKKNAYIAVFPDTETYLPIPCFH